MNPLINNGLFSTSVVTVTTERNENKLKKQTERNKNESLRFYVFKKIFLKNHKSGKKKKKKN